MKPLGFIYVTTCKTNGKIYVGKHEFSGDKHLNSHYLGSGILLRKAVKKYGKESFERKILKICFSINQLNGYETYYIRKLDARNPEVGYNLAKGGYGFRSGENNPSFGDGTKNPFYGKHHTDETKDKIRKKAYGTLSDEDLDSIDKEIRETENDKEVVDLTKESNKPEVNEVTVGDAEEYFNDLGLEYNVDYVDSSTDKASNVEERKEKEVDVEVNDSLKEDVKDEEDDNLFDLIDSMYNKED